jgi:hypothetical protein
VSDGVSDKAMEFFDKPFKPLENEPTGIDYSTNQTKGLV